MVESKSLGFRVFNIIIGVIMAAIAFACVAPLINTLAISFSDAGKAQAGFVSFWPIGFTLDAYKKIVADHKFLHSFLISVERVLLGGGLNMVLTIFMAYPLSKETKVFKARSIYMWIMVFTMLFNAGIIPWYLTIKQLGLIDSFWALILPGAVPVFNVIILMNFFRGVPKEIEEAAIVDGAGPWSILIKIFLPISIPSLATIGLFTVVGHWNSFFDGLMLMNSPDKYPLQTYIQQFVVVVDSSRIRTPEELKELMKLSGKTLNASKIFISMVPILLVYPFLQRYFITGLVLGSVKE